MMAKLSKEQLKAGRDRSGELAEAFALIVNGEDVAVFGATIASLTALFLMHIHKDDRLAAFQNLQGTIARMTADMEKNETTT